MTAAVISLVGSAVAFLFLRRHFALYQLVLLSTFLVGLTLSGELDVTLPVLILFSAGPYLRGVGKISGFALLFAFFSISYLFFGLICQSVTATLVTFLSRLMQFFVFYVVLENTSIRVDIPEIKLIVVFTIVETVIGFYLIKNGTMANNHEMEGVRLVSNSQPITGNIAICLMPLISYIYFYRSPRGKDLGLLAGCIAVLGFWVILSGTRGYTLVFGAGTALIFFDYLFSKGRERNRVLIAVFVLCVIMTVCLVLFAALQDQLAEKINSALRLNDSLGIRDQENKIALGFYKNESFANRVFGIGLGAKWGDYPEYVNAVQSVFGPSGVASKYIARSGTNFHNFYANILCLQGALGISFIAAFFLDAILKIRAICIKQIKMRSTLTIYVLMIALMLYFRWSADCGIIEFTMLAYVLKLISATRTMNKA